MSGASLWRFNARSGLWDHMRAVTDETAATWLRIFQGDEPDATFRVARRRPC